MARNSERLRWLAVLVCVAAVLVAGSSTALPLNGESLRLLLRKGAHVVLYACLALSLLWAFDARRRPLTRRPALTAMIVVVAFGVLDEWRQSAIPGRSGQLTDVGIDALGGGLGQIVAWVCRKM